MSAHQREDEKVSQRRRKWWKEKKHQHCSEPGGHFNGEICSGVARWECSHTHSQHMHAQPSGDLSTPLLLLVIRLSVSEKSGEESRGEEDERRREGVWCLIESVMLDFLWSPQQESAAPLTPSLKLPPSVSYFALFPSHFLFSFSCRSKMLSLSAFFLSPCPPSCSFSRLRLTCSSSDRSSLPVSRSCSSSPSQHAAKIWCCASFYDLACALSCMHVYWSAITSAFCVNLTQEKAVVNSTNQLGWRLQPAFHCRVQQREPWLIYYSSNSVLPPQKKHFCDSELLHVTCGCD